MYVINKSDDGRVCEIDSSKMQFRKYENKQHERKTQIL
jgi:hypothetical protein